MEIITSAQNPLIKETKKLQQKKYREEKCQYLIEGVRLVEEAYKTGQIVAAFYDDTLLKTSRGMALLHTIESENITLTEVSTQVLSTLAETETPQGIVAVLQKQSFGLAGFTPSQSGVILICDGVQDPGNLGTMLRTAWAAGVDALVCLPGTVDPYNGKTVRASMGGIFHVPVYLAPDWQELQQWLRSRNYQLVAGVPEESKNYARVKYDKKVALVIGNEAQGLINIKNEAVDIRVSIPLSKGAESLNAAVACGILLYEIARQRPTVV